MAILFEVKQFSQTEQYIMLTMFQIIIYFPWNLTQQHQLMRMIHFVLLFVNPLKGKSAQGH